MNITILNASRKHDGITRGMQKTSEILKNSGYEVKWVQVFDAYTKDSMPDSNLIIKGIVRCPKTLSMGLSRSRMISRKFRAGSSGIVILSEPTLINYMLNERKTIVRFHDFRAFTNYSDKLLTRLLYKRQLRSIRKVKYAIFSTDYIRNEAVKLGIAPENSLVIYDKPVFKISREHPDKSINRIRSGKITITCISTDRVYKDINLYLLISQKLEEKHPGKYRFVLVTQPSQNLKKKLERLPMINLVQEVDDITEIYDGTDIVVVPSKYEGFGLPFVESIYYGIPPVSRDLPPFREIAGMNELFQTSEDPTPWMESIEKLSEPEYYRKMSSMFLGIAEGLANDDADKKLKTFIESIDKQRY
jgi:hypothetical protein